MQIDIMTSDITSRVFEMARLFKGNEEGTLQEAGNTISALRDMSKMQQAKIADLRETVAERVRTINDLEVKIRKMSCKLEEMEQDKVTFRKLAEYIVDNQ